MGYLKIRWIKSTIGCPKDKAETIRSLGFKRLYEVRMVKNRPEIRGMIKKVIHHLEILEEIPDET